MGQDAAWYHFESSPEDWHVELKREIKIASEEVHFLSHWTDLEFPEAAKQEPDPFRLSRQNPHDPSDLTIHVEQVENSSQGRSGAVAS